VAACRPADFTEAVLFSEMANSAAFMGLAVLGFKRNLWLVVGALAGHGVGNPPGLGGHGPLSGA
jgi:hypothetical protein